MVERIRNVIKSDRKKGVEAPESEPMAKRSKKIKFTWSLSYVFPGDHRECREFATAHEILEADIKNKAT